MSKNSIESYGFEHISTAYDKAVQTINDYRLGRIVPAKTSYMQVNQALGGGFHKATIYVIGGRPSTGKSAFTNRMIFDICDLNDDVIVIYWNFEMPNYQQVIREIGAKEELSVNDLRSAEQQLALENYEKVKQLKTLFSQYPIYFNSHARSPEYIKNIVGKISDANPDKQIINVIDHSRLITSNNKKNEEERITFLLSVLRDLSVEREVTNFLISQLNREIEKDERMKRLGGPVPQQSDFFGADAVNQYANVALILQRPEMYDGLKQYMGYSRSEFKNMLFTHVVKNRDGKQTILEFSHEFEYNRMSELPNADSTKEEKTSEHGGSRQFSALRSTQGGKNHLKQSNTK